MDTTQPLGMHTSCGKCGGSNAWTGAERRGPWEAPAFGTGARSRLVEAEYRCSACGLREWAPLTRETEGAR